MTRRERQLGASAYFAILPEWVLYHPNLSAGAVRLFATLQRFANDRDHAWPSRATLAARIGVSKNTIDRYVAELVNAGAITKHRRADPTTGEWTSTLYWLRMIPPGAAAADSRTPATPSPAAADSRTPATPSPHAGTPSPVRGSTPGGADGATVAPPPVNDPHIHDPEAIEQEGGAPAHEGGAASVSDGTGEFFAELARRRQAREGVA